MKEQTFEDYRQRMLAVLVHIPLSGYEVLAAPAREFYLNFPQDMPHCGWRFTCRSRLKP